MGSRLIRGAAVMALAVSACTGDQADNEANKNAPDSIMAAVSAELAATRKKSADSLFSAVPEVAEVAKQLGASVYKVADAEIEAAVRRESAKTRDCYSQVVRDVDATLSVVLYVLANYGAAGWDLVRVEKWDGTSPAVATVVVCINSRAKAEWKLPDRNVRPGAHLVKLTYTPDSIPKGR